MKKLIQFFLLALFIQSCDVEDKNDKTKFVSFEIKNETRMNAWRDQLKFNKPAGVTDALIDELFLNYTPLQ
jgi:hypothetical protein